MKLILYLVVVVVGLLFVAALALYMLYGSLPASPPRVVEGERLLRVVRLDSMGLTIKNEDGSWMVCRNFELRVLEEGGLKSLLIRGTFVKDFRKEPDGRLVQTDAKELLYSDDAYAVALDGSFATRKVDEGAWSRARRFTEEESETEYGAGSKRVYFYHDGETLPRGGETRGGLSLTRLATGGAELEGWQLSQEGRYVAGFSHTSRRRPFKRPSLIPFLGEDDRIADGTMYVDIFDGATDRRLAQATKGHQGSYDMYVFHQARWFEGRYFAMPLTNDFGSWLVGALPE